MVTHNTFLLLLHTAIVSSFTLFALRLGKEALIAWLSFLAVAMNFFVLKQITLFGMAVTCSDALAVGYLLGLNLIQEIFRKNLARKTVWISFFISLSFVILSQIHLFYQPNSFDHMQLHYKSLLFPMPRLLFASFASFLIVQWFDLKFFAFLQRKTGGKLFTARTTLSLVVSQILDTLLFSFLGLFGLVHALSDVILFSLLIKGAVILLSLPFVMLCKKMVPREHWV